jgi:hypothetical protein
MSVKAQDLNPHEKTFLTFSSPVELPGMTLPAGTYVFKLADTPGRNVVQVMNQDETEQLGQFLFVQHTRTDPSTETVVTFRETREGATPAVQYWYYPNEMIGKEFIYPKDQAMRIAARTGATVRSDDGEVTANGAVASNDASASASIQSDVKPAEQPAEASVQAEASVPAQPTAPAGSLAGNRGAADNTQVEAQASAQTQPRNDTAVGTSGSADVNAQAESQTAPAELPRTASPLVLSGLLGLMSMFGAAGVRFFRS